MYELPRNLQRRHEIIDLVEWHGIVNVERLLEVHRTTIQRWCKGTIDVPIVAIIALRSLKGDFPHMEARKAWDGWRFGRDGKLYEPNGYSHTEGEIRATFFHSQLIRTLQERVKELEALLAKGNIQLNPVATNDPEAVPNTSAELAREKTYLESKPKRRQRW